MFFCWSGFSFRFPRYDEPGGTILAVIQSGIGVANCQSIAEWMGRPRLAAPVAVILATLTSAAGLLSLVIAAIGFPGARRRTQDADTDDFFVTDTKRRKRIHIIVGDIEPRGDGADPPPSQNDDDFAGMPFEDAA